MPEIVFFTDSNGRLSARWPGKSTYVPGVGSRKVGQKHLGLVVDREKNLFWNRKQGYFVFDPITETCSAPEVEDIPDANSFQPDGCKSENPPAYIDFGDAFFLDQLIHGTGYDKVLDAIPFRNRDTLYSMIQFYALDGGASTHALTWYRSSYASYLYPRANLSSQRISDFLKAVGTPEVRRAFLIAHIQYILESTDEELCVLIDSTGLPNSCDIPITCVSNHEGDVNIEFRMIAVVQKRTGLPLFFEVVAGNIVDITTLEHTITKLGEYGLRVNYIIGDAGYCCPGVVERLLLHGINFMSRLAPQYSLFKNAVKRHLDKLNDPKTGVKFKGRSVRVYKFLEPIVRDTETGEMKSCFIYLFRDEASFYSKSSHLYSSPKAAEMTCDELAAAAERMGVFAIITTEDLPVEDLLPEYYIRQNIEQYFDFGKNYAKFLPVRQHTPVAINGHLLISFIVTFLVVLIKNRMNILDTRYVCVCPKLYRETPEGRIQIALEELSGLDEKTVLIIEQDPLKDIFSDSPSSVFLSLRGLKAEVFETMIQPDIAQKDQREYLEAFGFANPTQVNRLPKKLVPVYKREPAGNTRVLAFTFPSTLSDEEILEKRKKKAQGTSKTKGQASSDGSADSNSSETQASTDTSTRKHSGQKLGSKNKATLEREAAIARGEIPPPKPKRSYNKKSKPVDPPESAPKD